MQIIRPLIRSGDRSTFLNDFPQFIHCRITIFFGKLYAFGDDIIVLAGIFAAVRIITGQHIIERDAQRINVRTRI